MEKQHTNNVSTKILDGVYLKITILLREKLLCFSFDLHHPKSDWHPRISVANQKGFYPMEKPVMSKFLSIS